MLRTHTCGELTEKNVGEKVTLCGWVDTIRDHGGVTFIDLRDRYGKTQIVASAAFQKKIQQSGEFKPESCIRVSGAVKLRPKGTDNLKLATGKIEIEADGGLESSCAGLPFEVAKSTETNEELRMQYRYLDLRNPAVQKNLFLRHRIYQIIRRELDKENFIEVETPILTKSTPEGARDYLVPSRVNQGEFYALPQSPQLFKQILMVSGFDRYFQIAKCFRDEDLRADRQPEFTQLDMEMSFLEEKDLFRIVENVLAAILKGVVGVDLKTPFPRMTYREAMDRYGSDKPDLRFGLSIHNISEVVKNCEFKVFQEALASPQSVGGQGKKEGAVLGICLPKGGDASRKDMDNLTEFVKTEGVGGLAYFRVGAGSPRPTLDSPITKFFNAEIQKNIIERFGAKPDDLILAIAGAGTAPLRVLGALRLHVAKWKNLIPKNEFHFSWVTDFPLFKYNEEEKRWDSEHHPFTSPNIEDWEKYWPSVGNGRDRSLQLDKILSRAYDLVLNGNEIASGSIRIHKREMQKAVFDTIGLSEKEIGERFGFLLKAFEFGAPPHGGIALGIDRVVAILLGLESIREVIAFPKNQKAVDPMTDAPSPVAEKQLKELGIKIR